MTEFRFSSRARRDLAEIVLYLIENDDSRASSFLDRLEARLAEIADRPLGFPGRDDLAAGLRASGFGSYLLFFRIADDHLKLVRIVHQARDLRRMFV